jgi:hypothetical protein
MTTIPEAEELQAFDTSLKERDELHRLLAK